MGKAAFGGSFIDMILFLKRLSIFLFLVFLLLFLAYYLLPPYRSFAAVIYSQPYYDDIVPNYSGRYVIKWTPDREYNVKSISVGCYNSNGMFGDLVVYRVSDKTAVITDETWTIYADGDESEGFWSLGSDTGYTFSPDESYYFTCGYGINNGVYRKLKNVDYIENLSIGTIALGLNNYSPSSDVEPLIALCDVNSPCSFSSVEGDTTTRIISVVPPNATTTATSTSFVFGATGYVNSSDFQDGMRLKMRYYNNKNDMLVGPLIAISDDAKSDGIFTWDITSFGDFEFSTTTVLIRKGKHFLTTAVESPRFNFLGFKFFYRTIAATSTWFVVSEYTDYDIITGATTTTPFGITASGNFIFDKAREFAEDLARKVPWGYGYRVYEIMTSDVSSRELPNISFTLPSFLAGSGKGVTLDPWSPVSNTLAYADTKSGVNFGPFYEQGESLYDSFYRWWRFFWYLAFSFWLFRRLILAYNQGDFDFLGDDGREEWMSRAGDVYTVSELEKMNLRYKAKKSYFKI